MRHRAAAAAVALLAAMANAGAADAPPPPAAATPAVVEQPRPFGHAVGDVVTQRVLLQRTGADFEPAALPGDGRIGAWFERRTPRIERREGARWLVVDYQLVNAPQELRTVTLPAWRIEPRGGGAALAIDAWPLSVAPLTPRTAFGQGGLVDLLPDRAAPLLDTRSIRAQLALWAGASLLVLAAWAAWTVNRNRRDASLQPFARAWRELRGLGDDTPQAWQALHRAFDRAAGRVVQPATLETLFERAPHLDAMRPPIERFYAESQARFFGGDDAPRTSSPRALCAALRRLEKRHVR